MVALVKTVNPNPRMENLRSFPKGVSGNARGPGRIRWLRGLLDKKFDHLPFAKKLNLCLRYGDGNLRMATAMRLLEIAFTDEVFVIGRDENGAPIERASSRESIEAIKTLWSYDLGLPRKQEDRIGIPSGLDPSAPLLDLAVAIYRHRMVSGKMGETEFADMVKAILSVDSAKVALVLKLMGKDSTKSAEDILRMLDRAPATEPQVDSSRDSEPAPDSVPATSPDAGAGNGEDPHG